MNQSRAYKRGRSGKIEFNPYDSNTDEFDEFERGRTQWIKADSNDSWGCSDDYDLESEDNDHNPDVEKQKRTTSKENRYLKAKGKL